MERLTSWRTGSDSRSLDQRNAWHTSHVAGLRKRDVETLLADYDRDPVAAITVAMRKVLGQPDADYTTLVRMAPFDDERRARLLAIEVDSLDALARELNEVRTLAGSDGS